MHNIQQQNQQGVTLLTALLLLFIMTLLTLSSINTTTLDSKVSSNLRNRDLSFQAAETTLKQAEAYIHNTYPLPSFDGSDGRLPYDPTRDLANDTTWDNLSSHAGASLPDILHITHKPEYIIEQLPAVGNSNGSLEAGLSLEESYYRITAKAQGATGNATVIVQSVYKR